MVQGPSPEGRHMLQEGFVFILLDAGGLITGQ